MFLRRLKQQKYMRDFGTFDIETRNKKFLLCGFYLNGKYKLFFDPVNAVKWLSSRQRQDNFFYAHGLRYDGTYLINSLRALKKEFKFIDSGGKMLELKAIRDVIQKEDRVLKNFTTLRDSFALFSTSQAELANIFGVKTKKYEVKFEELEAMPLEEAMPEYLKRNKTDCIGLYEILKQAQAEIFKDFDIDLRGCMTISQLALKCFRSSFMEADIWNPLVNGTYKSLSVMPEAKFFEEAYAGGRVEIFNMNQHPRVLGFDVNSMYPSVMLNSVPFGKFKMVNNPRYRDLLFALDNYEGFAEINFSTRDDYIPLLWKKINGKLLFANFEETTAIYAFPEIRKAIENGAIIHSIKRMALFQNSAPIFAEFIKKIYAMRKQAQERGDKGRDYLYKNMMNHLYGKFAQKPERENMKILTEAEVLASVNDVFDSGTFYYEKEKQFKPTSFYMPFISAYVTSYARVKLYDYLIKAKHPVYCDTDSVICYWLEEDSKELGEMKLEKVLDNFIAFNPKVYQSDQVKKAKGIPQYFLDKEKAKKKGVRYINDLRELYKEPVEWESLCSLRKAATVKSNITYSDGAVKYVKMSRSFKNKYNKREVLEDGNTRPFWIVNGELTPKLIEAINR